MTKLKYSYVERAEFVAAPRDLLMPIPEAFQGDELKIELIRRLELGRQYLRILQPTSRSDEEVLFATIDGLFPRALTVAKKRGPRAITDEQKRSLARWVDKKKWELVQVGADTSLIIHRRKELLEHFPWLKEKKKARIANLISEGRQLLKLQTDVLEAWWPLMGERRRAAIEAAFFPLEE